MEELELGRLDLRRDSGVIVLTNIRVYHQGKNTFMGLNSTVIPLQAITGLKVAWERSPLLLFFGILSLGGWGFAWLQNIFAPVQYLLLFAVVMLLVGFAFCKENKIEIATPTTTISGHPKNFHDAKRFCDLVLSAGLKSSPPIQDTAAS